MKHLFLIAIIIGVGILSRAQTEYVVVRDGQDRLLKGLVSRQVLEDDTAFGWFRKNQEGYAPDAGTVSVLRAKGPELQFLVFGGTWCHDTQTLLPRFFRLMDAAGIGNDQVSVVMVDRHKQAIGTLPQQMHLTGTPTFVVMKGGKEIGRVVEYGRQGQWEKELGDIVRLSD